MHEPFDVSLMRAFLRRWPLPRGQGVVMRAMGSLLGRRRFLMRVESGVYVEARLTDYVDRWCFIHGYDRDPAVRLSRRLIAPGSTVVDAGANVGMWLMGAARQAGSAGRVIAAEPAPENLTRLTRHLSMNDLDWVEVVPSALGAVDGIAQFYLPSNENSALGSLRSRPGVGRPISVSVRTLDGVLAERGVERVDFLKVDVEGAEGLVLDGAKLALSREDAPVVFFEADDSLAQRFGEDSRSVKQRLYRNGYVFFTSAGSSAVSVDVGTSHAHDDLFAVRPNHFKCFPWLRRLVSRPA